MFAIDFDGTVADMGSAKAAWIEGEMGLRLNPWECDRTSCMARIGEDAYFRMIAEVNTVETSRRLRPIEGALAALPKLAARGRVEIVTARKGDEVGWAEAWLRHHGVGDSISALHSAHGTSKIELALRRGLTWLVDDDARHLDDVERNELRQIHLRVGRPDAQARGGGAARPFPATSWSDVLRRMGL